MRYSKRGAYVHLYDPQSAEKKEIKAWIQACLPKDFTMFLYPRVSFVFHMPILKSTSKRDLPLYTSGRLKHNKKPDVDNLAKLYLDCMDNICFEGDQRVVLGPAVKLYHPHPKTIIVIEDMSAQLNPSEVDAAVWCDLFETDSDKQSSFETDYPPY